jgi:hypothetical protein
LDDFLEPRSKIFYDGPDSGGGDSCPMHVLLFLPILVFVLLLTALMPVLGLMYSFLKYLGSEFLQTVRAGTVSHPGLAKTGWLSAPLLYIAARIHPEGTLIHPHILFVAAAGFVLCFSVLPALALGLRGVRVLRGWLISHFGAFDTYGVCLAVVGLCIAVFVFSRESRVPPAAGPASTSGPAHPTAERLSPTFQSTPTAVPQRSVEILVDDFRPRPLRGDTAYFFNRLEGDRGTLNDSLLDWGSGEVKATIASGNSWGGLWMSLNHPIREALPINFSAVLPAPIQPAFQSRITAVTVQLKDGTPGRIFRMELKNGASLRWQKETLLDGGPQTVRADLPPLENISQLVLVLDRARGGDYVVVKRIALTASTPVTDTALAAFVWSYGMLLNNWNPSTGLVRDKAKDASGEFDAVPSTGALAAASVVAWRLGIIRRTDAAAIVNTIGGVLLSRLPRHRGLWPHWVSFSADGKIGIAAVALLDAQSALGMDTAGTEQMLRGVEWGSLVTNQGISHGYTYSGERIPYTWDTFGGESWLVELAYAAATGKVAPLPYSSPPTANGSGFIDEMAWLYALPPAGTDVWGTDWSVYRSEAAAGQIAYYADSDPDSCFAQMGWFGLSAAEVPSPADVPKQSIYQAFGVGGRFAPADDGSPLLGSAVAVPHYSALAASLQPDSVLSMWDQLIEFGLLSPLNNVESITFPDGSDCRPDGAEWNSLKGSWNLSLQTLGWGRYLEQRDGRVSVLWQAMKADTFLNQGYLLLASNELALSNRFRTADESVAMILTRFQNACSAEPLNRWSLPGDYYYSYSPATGRADFVFRQTSRARVPNYGMCPYMPWGNLEEAQEDSSTTALATRGGYFCFLDSSFPPVPVRVASSGSENIATPWGILQALALGGSQSYNIFTSNLSNPNGTLSIREWYLCGVGIFRLTIDHKGSYQGRDFKRLLILELMDFQPAD